MRNHRRNRRIENGYRVITENLDLGEKWTLCEMLKVLPFNDVKLTRRESERCFYEYSMRDKVEGRVLPTDLSGYTLVKTLPTYYDGWAVLSYAGKTTPEEIRIVRPYSDDDLWALFFSNECFENEDITAEPGAAE